MPTPEDDSSAVLRQKILESVLTSAAIEGWTQRVYDSACAEVGVLPADIAYAFPDGISSLVPFYFTSLNARVTAGLGDLPLDDMRIRDKVSGGVELWFEALSRHAAASRKALDWCAARPLGPLSMPECLWAVADTIWNGIGDTSLGFTHYSKRTTLSAVLGSTLAVWRRAEGDETIWRDFLARRIEDVMTFEKFKAQLKLPEVKLPF